MRVGGLARAARDPGSLQTVVQAVWKGTRGKPRPIGPVGRVHRTMKQLGWQALGGWWLWQLEPLGMIPQPWPTIIHRLREALRRPQPQRLGQRRPRRFAGRRGEILRDVLDKNLTEYPEGWVSSCTRLAIVGKMPIFGNLKGFVAQFCAA